MTPARRRMLDALRPRDTREIVVVNGHELSCDQFKAQCCIPSVACVDAMPAEWRALIREYGPLAHELYDKAIPMFANEKPLTAGEAREILERYTADREKRMVAA